MPLAVVSSKFYLSLTLSTPAPEVETKQELYAKLEALSLTDVGFQPKMLDDGFFKGLDKLFQDHLLPTFQTFGVFQNIPVQYDQNNAQSLEDLDEDEEAEPIPSQEKVMLSLNWGQKFWEEYVPGVTSFVAKWVEKRRRVLKEQSQVDALNAVEEKVAQYFKKEEGNNSGFSTVTWHSGSVDLPFMTPIFLNVFLMELNEVQDAAISVSNPQVSWNILTIASRC